MFLVAIPLWHVLQPSYNKALVETRKRCTLISIRHDICSHHMAAIPELLQNRLSDNVGGVKQFSNTLQHVLIEERPFALRLDSSNGTRPR
jgi:hypothetical protein